MLTKGTATHTLTTTVVMPAYNTARYIRQAIESALAQTVRDFELIVVDDGSTDGTAEIVEEFAQRDARVRLIRQPNQGIGAARNTAMAHGSGCWFALLDSDDLWFPTYLAEQFAVITRRPDLAVLSANALNLGGPNDGRPYQNAFYPHEIQHVSLLELIRREDAVCILSMFRREVVDTIGGFDTDLRSSEDYDFWLRAAVAGFRIGFNPKPLGAYRRRTDSVSADEARMLEAIVIPLERVRQICECRPDIHEAAGRQLARFARRRLVVSAKKALLRRDVAALTQRFVELHRATDALKYRVGTWLCTVAPPIVFWIYGCKTVWVRQRARMRHRTATRRDVAAGGSK
jgi:glycosyltransferase involved in cell wall biosynthesis